MARDIDRRRLMKGVGAASIVGMAGCITQSPGTDTPSATSTEGGGGGDETDGGGDETDTEASGGAEIDFTAKLGVLMPLTGDLASVGKPIRDGATLAPKQLQDADIPIGIDYQVEDTATNPQNGIQSANSLVNSGYPAITGPASSGVNLAVAKQVLIPNGVVGCSPSSTSPNVTTLKDNDLVFRTAPSDALQGRVMARVADNKLGDSTASVMYVNNDYGQALANVFKKAFVDNHSGSVQKMVAFKKEKSSYTSELSTAMNDSPSMLVVIGYPASGIQIFRDFYADYNNDTDILVTDGLQDGTLPDSVGNDMSNVYGTVPKPSGPGNEAFSELYNEEYGRAPAVFNAHAYDASAVQLLATAAAQENDGAAIADKMREVANPNDGKEITAANLPEGISMAANGEAVYYTGASSAVDFDENGDMKAVAYSYWKFNTDTESNIETLDTIKFGAQ